MFLMHIFEDLKSSLPSASALRARGRVYSGNAHLPQKGSKRGRSGVHLLKSSMLAAKVSLSGAPFSSTPARHKADRKQRGGLGFRF